MLGPLRPHCSGLPAPREPSLARALGRFGDPDETPGSCTSSRLLCKPRCERLEATAPALPSCHAVARSRMAPGPRQREHLVVEQPTTAGLRRLSLVSVTYRMLEASEPMPVKWGYASVYYQTHGKIEALREYWAMASIPQ